MYSVGTARGFQIRSRVNRGAQQVTVHPAQNKPAARPVILFVLGMGRSGSSALTRVLSLCGAALPVGMVGADSGNPRGYWEPRAAILLNRGILDRHGSAWWDPTLRLQEEGEFDARERAACIADISAYLAKLPAAPLVVIKDLNIGVLSSMWFEAARLTGFDIATVITVRHPREVNGSLATAVRASPELSSALWLKGNLLAERNTRDVPRVVVEYANLLEDWRKEITRMSAALDINLDSRDERAVEEFLAPDLRRNRESAPVADRFGTDWISTVYRTMQAAARDEPWDTSTLDRVFEEYRASEHDFRKALDGSRGYFDSGLNKLLRPSIVKPILELRAIAHRRKGTWA
jgi:hypothetical protein